MTDAPTTSEISRHLRQVLDGSSTVKAFEEWLLEATRGLTDESDATHLADELNGLLMELAGGHMTVRQFIARAQPLAYPEPGTYLSFTTVANSTFTIVAATAEDAVKTTTTPCIAVS